MRHFDADIAVPVPPAGAGRRQQESEEDSQQGGGDGMASRPFEGPFPARRRSAADRLVIEEAAQFIGQFRCAGVTLARHFVEALQTNSIQIARAAGLVLARRRRFLELDLLENVHQRLALERRSAGEHFVEEGAQGVDVGGGGDRACLAGGLFRGHVGRGAQDAPLGVCKL